MPDDELKSLIVDEPENDFNLRELLAQLSTPLGVIPFVGAGLSKPFGFPEWKEFLRFHARRAGIEKEVEQLAGEGKYEEAAEHLLEALSAQGFHDAVEEAFGDDKIEGKSLAGAVSVLPRLAAGPLVTTNFDHVLERVFAQAGQPFAEKVWGAKADMVVKAFQRDRRYLLKIHGDVEDRTDRILTRSEYEERYGGLDPASFNPDLPLPSLLHLMLESRPLLFLGCSLGEDRTMAVLKLVSARLPGIRHYAVVGKPAADEEFHKRRRHLNAHGIRPIWYPSGRHDLVELLLAYLAEQRPARPAVEQSPSRSNRLLSGPYDPLLAHRREFYGRAEEVGKVLAFLDSSASLATVTAAPEVYNVKGAPGIGKTEVCREAIKQYLLANRNQRAYYVNLADAENEVGLLVRLAEALGIEQVESRDQALASARAAPGLVYLDNLEDVVADAKAVDLVQSLAAIPGVRVLASCRETLEGIAINIPIDSLDLDSAVQLFRKEWERSGAKPLPDSPELRDFLEKDLSRHPLSIVLVAAQAPEFGSLAAIRQAWREEWNTLARLPRGPENPLTSLEVSMSYSLAAVRRELPAAVTLWGLMGLFPEGLSTAAWQAIFRDQVDQTTKARRLLLRLNLAWADAQDALHVLAPLRQFILDRAKKGEAGLDGESLAGLAYPYFCALAREAYEHLWDDKHTTTLDALLAEFPNLHHFILFASELGGDWPPQLSTLSFHLLNYYQFRVLLGEEMLRSLLAVQQAAGLSRAVAQSAEHLGELELRLGKPEEAEAYYRQAIQLFQAERANLGLANTLRRLGDLELFLRKDHEAEAHFRQAIQLLESESNNIGLANAIHSLGYLEYCLDKLDEAEAHYRQAMGLFQAERDNLGLANALMGLGDLARGRKDFDKARALYAEARRLNIGERHDIDLAYTCSELARVCHADRDAAGRDEFLREAIAAAKASNTPKVLEYVLGVVRETGSNVEP